MKSLLVFFGALLFFYLCGAFIFVSFDLNYWNEFGRTLIVVLGVPSSALVATTFWGVTGESK